MVRSKLVPLFLFAGLMSLGSGCGLLEYFGLSDSQTVEPDVDQLPEPRAVNSETKQSASARAINQLPSVPAGAELKPVRIGVVTFLSGPAAGPFGVPARNAAEIVAEELNSALVPAPYGLKGFGGSPIQLVFLDEVGGPAKQVEEYKNLIERRNVDMVIGYISSGDCLAIAPVAEGSKKLTILFDCGTPRIFEDASYKYVFRPVAHSVIDSVGAALYVSERRPAMQRIAGINQNYAWGQDSWAYFEATMKAVRPDVEIPTTQWPKLLSGQYGTEISALLLNKPDVVHCSFWGSDLEAFVLQASPRGLFKKSTVVLTAGETALYRLASQIPDGTVIGARGPNGPFAPDNVLNKWFRDVYRDRFALYPNFAAYHMAQAILGVKAAYEKAEAQTGALPTHDQIINAFENLNFESPSGKVRMALGKGHQAIQGTAYGMTKIVKGQLSLTNVQQYTAEQVNPPEGVKSADWIKSLRSVAQTGQ